MKILAGPHNWGYFTESFQLGLRQFDLQLFRYSDEGLHWNDTLETLLASLPPGWEPDWVIWWLPEYLRIMPGIEECPYPTLLVISDWNVGSEPLCRMAEAFDVVATDTLGFQRLKSFAVQVPVFQAPLYGFTPGLHRVLPEVPRDIPVGYIGNTNGSAYSERMRTVARACQGLKKGELVVASGVYGEDYVRMLNRCMITLNHSLRGELNMRTFEAMACGSLVFCEDTNLEAGEFFQDGEHLVFFNQENLADRLNYYLDRPDELAELARNGHRRVQDFSYPRQWSRLLDQARKLYAGKQRPFKQLNRDKREFLYADYCYNVFSPLAVRASTGRARETRHSQDQLWLNLLGCQLAAQADLSEFGERESLFSEAAQNLSQVNELGLLPKISLARVLVSLGRSEEAVEVLEQALHEKLPVLPVSFYPRLMHPLAFLWESETDADKRERAVHWMAHDLLSALDTPNRVIHARRALEYRSDQATTWIRLSRCQELNVEERLAALNQAILAAPYLLESYALRLESVQADHPDYQRFVTEASLAVGSLSGPDFDQVKERLEERLRRALSPSENGAVATIGEFAQGIEFKFCSPDIGLNNLFLWEPTKSIELWNTEFPVEDRALKERLSPIADVPRMSTLALAGLINRAVEQMPDDRAYLNIGVWNGYSFLAGLIQNPDKRCIGVDNFSQFGGPQKDFLQRFDRLKGPAHSFHDMDYEVYLRSVHTEPLGLYFYDGEHSYKNQFIGLKAAEKFFAPGCLILVDDTNWDDPRKATLDFVRQSRRRYRILLDVRTPYSGHPTWWNGLILLEHLGPIRKRRRR